ncbi:hypothetical protein QPX44_03880 [Corynebacterium pseudodiphtheriticum]|nr:hypothetical protein [Corynebacterium pseudodiphtheriticum]MDK4240165.1 hypothetical protein [Corynebacterium pseudodiphtheriticum]MDK4286267.1 hypothetical protein [Corynebacterium pseudodiphtheriticum]MDK4315310.1 hypothetical protein [Corynebacterium pseudodiphtheriticum]
MNEIVRHLRLEAISCDPDETTPDTAIKTQHEDEMIIVPMP